ncbi:hypothetical protein V493_00161 [Pseudogymnoascus sp. VKM F-4281 (FW-2241)]|nr:hypothetical protein V493_00161 [Pseudogymnoascus sp. VKM F-4281 (FW-2241)]
MSWSDRLHGQTGYPTKIQDWTTRLPNHPTTTTTTTMVKRRSIKAQERDFRLSEAILGIQTRKYKSANAAAVALGLRPDTVRRRVSGVQHTQAEAQLPYQLLSKNQEIILLKWIKGLTASGYAPSHRILREVAEEVRSNKCRVFQDSARLTSDLADPIKPTGPAADPTDPANPTDLADPTDPDPTD